MAYKKRNRKTPSAAESGTLRSEKRVHRFRRALPAALLSAVFLLSPGCDSIDLSEYFGYSRDVPGTSTVSATEAAPETIASADIKSTSEATEETGGADTHDSAAEQEIAATSEVTADIDTKEITAAEENLPLTEESTPDSTILKVHFIDVGQGDSCFIELPNGETMLIDAGESECGDSVVTYIYSQGYGALDYVVATHPHSDHIGGMEEVLSTLPAGGLYMPPCPANTEVYEKMLGAAESSGVTVHEVMAGYVISDADGLKAEVVAPKEIAGDMNNNSVVIKLTYGENIFLFTGDAEKKEEDGIWTNIKCDVLKLGHHGSKTSTSANFLKKTEPTYAVISCGLANSYGHPGDAVLKRLEKRNISVFRTDIQGTVIFTSDGKDITVNLEPVPFAAGTQE